MRDHLWSIRLADSLKAMSTELAPATTSPVFHGPRLELHAQSSPFLLRQLNLWANTPESTLLVIRVGLRAEPAAKWVAVSVTRLLQTANPVVLWIVQLSSTPRHSETLATTVLRSLVAQALTHDAIKDKLHGIKSSSANMPQFSTGQHTSVEWLSLLCLIVQEIPNIFLVVDAGSLGTHSSGAGDENTSGAKGEEAELISLLQMLVDAAGKAGRCRIKLLVLSYHQGRNDATNSLTEPWGVPNTNRMDVNIQLPPPVPAARRHIVARQAQLFRLQMRGVIQQN